MGPITATLLSYMSPSLAYTSLVRLHDAYAMHSVFAPGFPGLLEAIYVQERLTQVTMPAVYAAFQKHMISVKPWPKPFADGLAGMLEDPTVAGHL